MTAWAVGIYTFVEPGPVVPTRISYKSTPTPADQVKVALEPVSVLPGVEVSNAAGTGVLRLQVGVVVIWPGSVDPRVDARIERVYRCWVYC